MAFPIQLIQFIAGLAALIILHEIGHFVAARLLKIPVDEFGIGFPPRLVKLFEAGGTEYTLNWIPLGGFVRPRGENDPNVPGGMAAANPWVRLGILAAGPGMNLLIGIILAIFLFYSLGDPILNQVRIDSVVADSPAEQVGLKAGDMVLQVNGQAVDSSEKLQSLIRANLDKPTSLVYQRGGQTLTVTLTPRGVYPANQGPVGVTLGHPTQPISFITAIGRGAQAASDYALGILQLPLRIIQGQTSPQEGRPIGFKGMFDIYTQIQSPLFFFMAISMSLGIFNLFPIPALDGGRILLTLPEIFLRRRIPPEYENMIHLVGFTLLLILIIYVNVQDFINPIVLPK